MISRLEWTPEEDALIVEHQALFAPEIANLLSGAGYERSEDAVRARRLRLTDGGPRDALTERAALCAMKGNAAQAERRDWPQGLCDPFAEFECDRNLHKDAEHVRNLLRAQLEELRRSA
jgi:hypothetical protein